VIVAIKNQLLAISYYYEKFLYEYRTDEQARLTGRAGNNE